MVIAKHMSSATGLTDTKARGNAPVRRLLAHELTYWFVVLLSAALLLWGWALAIENVIKGTTVKLG